jgi:hypothetical protein
MDSPMDWPVGLAVDGDDAVRRGPPRQTICLKRPAQSAPMPRPSPTVIPIG